jgi:hypothetical protein
MKLIENEGALFRGPARNQPHERWDGKKWIPYTGSKAKPYEWGHEITQAEFDAIVAEDAALGR